MHNLNIGGRVPSVPRRLTPTPMCMGLWASNQANCRHGCHLEDTLIGDICIDQPDTSSKIRVDCQRLRGVVKVTQSKHRMFLERSSKHSNLSPVLTKLHGETDHQRKELPVFLSHQGRKLPSSYRSLYCSYRTCSIAEKLGPKNDWTTFWNSQKRVLLYQKENFLPAGHCRGHRRKQWLF
jgi:hypothetical protein